MNYFAKFKKFLPHSIIIPTVGSQMPELDRGAFPPYKIGSQNTPYKLGLKCIHRDKYGAYYYLIKKRLGPRV